MRTIKGVDYLVVLDKANLSPVLLPTERKWKPHEIHTAFEGMPVFIANRNDQFTPHNRKGLLCYFRNYNMVGAIVAAKGPNAVALVLAPVEKKGKIMPVNLLYAGFSLQQICGKRIWDFNTVYRPKQFDMATGNVLPLLDANGYIKFNRRGPDILGNVPIIPKEYRSYVRDDWVIHNEDVSCPARGELIPVMYVLCKKGWDRRHVEYTGSGKERRGFYSVPVGSPITAGTGTHR